MKKSFFTTLICLIVILSNISIIALAQNNLLDHTEEINEELKNNISGGGLENYFNNNSDLIVEI